MNHLLFIRIVTQSLRKMLFDGVLCAAVPPYRPIADTVLVMRLVGFVRNYSYTLGPAIKLLICVTIIELAGKYVIYQSRWFDTVNEASSNSVRENQAIVPWVSINYCFSNRHIKLAASFRATRFSHCDSSDSHRNHESTYNATSDRRHNSLSD